MNPTNHINVKVCDDVCCVFENVKIYNELTSEYDFEFPRLRYQGITVLLYWYVTQTINVTNGQHTRIVIQL